MIVNVTVAFVVDNNDDNHEHHYYSDILISNDRPLPKVHVDKKFVSRQVDK